MLRKALQQASLGTERAGQSCTASTSRALHVTTPSAAAAATSALARPPPSKGQIRQHRKEREEKREIKRRLEELTRPDPVLGRQLNESGNEYWKASELSKLILSKDQVWGVQEDRRGNLVEVQGEGHDDVPRLGPKRLNFGLDNAHDRQMLFSDLSSVILEDQMARAKDPSTATSDELAELEAEIQMVHEAEAQHAQVLGRVLDLRNASGKGIQVENVRRIIEHFGGRPEGDERGPDTGSVEVQTAVLTYRIINLQEHLESGTARHDNQNRRGMALLVYQRARLLKYLKRKSPARYEALLPRIGVEARAVEGEVVVPGKPRMKITS